MVTEGLERKTLAKQVAEELYDLQLDSNKKKEKDYKLSFSQRAGHKGKVKKNKAFTILMLTNGGFSLKWRQIQDDQVYVKEVDKFYSTTTDCVGYYKSYPVVLIAEWDLQAYSRKYLWDKSGEGRYANPQTVIIHNILRAMNQMNMKKGLGGKNIIWIILIIGIVLYMGYQALL